MYNRYCGNSGHAERVPEPHELAPPQLERAKSARTNPLGALGSLLPRSMAELEQEDLLLILILYLMYRESGDKELLVMLGTLFL